MAHMWDSALHSEPTLHGNSAWPELHRSSQWSEISRPDHCSTIDNFDRSFAWLKPSRSVSTSRNWIIHQSASSLWHRSWNRVVHLCILSFIMWSEFYIFHSLVFQNFPSSFYCLFYALEVSKFSLLPSSFWNLVSCPPAFEIPSSALNLLKFGFDALQFLTFCDLPSGVLNAPVFLLPFIFSPFTSSGLRRRQQHWLWRWSQGPVCWRCCNCLCHWC